jgi:hypothetical protein
LDVILSSSHGASLTKRCIALTFPSSTPAPRLGHAQLSNKHRSSSPICLTCRHMASFSVRPKKEFFRRVINCGECCRIVYAGWSAWHQPWRIVLQVPPIDLQPSGRLFSGSAPVGISIPPPEHI